MSEEDNRQRKMTEKGFQFNVEQQLHILRSIITKWNESAERLNVLLSDTSDVSKIKTECDILIAVAKELRTSRDRLRDIVLAQDQSSADIEGMFRAADSTEAEHHKLIIETSNTLCDLRFEGSIRSRASTSSRVSKVSSHSKATFEYDLPNDNDRVSKLNSMKIKLKYIDAESQARLNYEKIKLKRSLEIAEANLNVCKEGTPDKHFDLTSNYIPTHIWTDVPTDYHNDILDINPSDIINEMPFDAADEIVPDRKPMLSRPKPEFPHFPNYSTHILPVKDLSPPKQSIEGELSQVVKTLTQQVMLSRLPPPERSVFTGDALKYPGWKREFQTLIEH